ncbi:hypothetical protein CDAR_565421 [Caerostris darwini]|uniref:Uncharacterized protein n=1 Tax=Caerostris darwini TaxID=1538125 RepID=A0AAV4TTZ6_9ARAC|nr:hypothetical protein CDAR_565421 [Caerostris darwini]
MTTFRSSSFVTLHCKLPQWPAFIRKLMNCCSALSKSTLVPFLTMVIAGIYPTILLCATPTPQLRIKRKPSNSASIRKMWFRSSIATHPPFQHDYISHNELAPRWTTHDSNQGVNSISFGMLGMPPQAL